mgnify:CR=1 FL=1
MTSHDNVTDIVERIAPLLEELETGQDCAEYAYAKGKGFQAMTYCPEAFEALKELPEYITTLRKQLENAREVIIEANNSLYGSQGYFLSLNGGPPNKYHLAEGIEELKSNVRRLGISGWHFAKGMVCHDPQ